MKVMKDVCINYNIPEIALCLIAFTIPLWLAVNNGATIFTLVLSFIFYSKNNFKEFLYKDKINLSFVLLFVLMVLSMLYTEDFKTGLKILGRAILFIIFPIIFTNLYQNINKINQDKILRFFVIGILLSTIICLIKAFLNTYEFASVNPFNVSNGNFFSYIKFTEIIKIHPIYIASEVLFSISIVIYDIYKGTKILGVNIFFKIFMIFYLLIILMLLNSFIMVINLIIISFIFGIMYFKKHHFKMQHILFVIFILLSIFSSSHFLIEKFKGIHILDDIRTTDFSGSDFTAIKARKAKAFCAIQVIKEHPLLGVGIGDGENELFRMYKKFGFEHGYKLKFNAHNEYLTTFIALGFLGFFILIFNLVNQLLDSFRHFNFLQMSFIVIMLMFFLTESVLERQNGIVFFLFFSCLFSVLNNKIKN